MYKSIRIHFATLPFFTNENILTVQNKTGAVKEVSGCSRN